MDAKQPTVQLIGLRHTLKFLVLEKIVQESMTHAQENCASG